MAEFVELPFTAGDRFKNDAWSEIRTAIINRGEAIDSIAHYSFSYGAGDYPTAVPDIGDLPGLIEDYRAKIDALIPYFYVEATDTLYTVNSLHTAAFGQTAWRELSFPCRPQKLLWNDMKACLDLMKWVCVQYQDVGDGDDPFDGYGWQSGTHANYATWNGARQAYFSNLSATANVVHLVGHRAMARYDSGDDDYDAKDDQATPYSCPSISGPAFTFGPWVGTSPAVVDGAFVINTWGYGRTGPTWHPPIPILFKINTVRAHVDDFETADGKAGGTDTIRLDDISSCGLNDDGTDNDMVLEYDGTITDDRGVGDWPAPTESTWRYFASGKGPREWHVMLKLSWD